MRWIFCKARSGDIGRAARSLAGQRPDDAGDVTSVKGLHVLLVDDGDTRDFLANTLRHYEADATAVGSVREALVELNRACPHVLVCNCAMSDVDAALLNPDPAAARGGAATPHPDHRRRRRDRPPPAGPGRAHQSASAAHTANPGRHDQQAGSRSAGGVSVRCPRLAACRTWQATATSGSGPEKGRRLQAYSSICAPSSMTRFGGISK